MKHTTLHQAVQSAAGLRLRLRLQPLYGQGEIIFPCTVAGGKYQTSKRRIPGFENSVECTIIDSVQSQANRMEDALLADIRAGNIFLPHIVTDFSGIGNDLEKAIGAITCFEAPHRIFDAIIRDSVNAEGKHFPFTKEGKAAIKANSKNATAVYEISPASLLFGSWDSTGISGGLGEKYTRCVVSELAAVNIEKETFRAGTREDPLNIAKESFAASMKSEAGKNDDAWTALAVKAAAKKKKLENASDINHSSVPWDGENKTTKEMHGGVTCDYIQQSTTISFAALRQLHFLVDSKDLSSYGQTVLAAIALHAAALNVERGWHLRSRCDLIHDDGAKPEWVLLGASSSQEALTTDITRQILNESIEQANTAGLTWRDTPIQLTPSPALRELVINSQKAHRETAPAE
ncbi:MAG: type I-U CRISPR-associated protein Cas7 [Verrucomicrobia bacterium]|nr:MAG: type I-U CRISPR-associated protein Cas7 [Verrucomicrobiota bacterium]